MLSRLLAKSQEATGLKFRFFDQRKKSKSLAFQVFNAKKARKEALYVELLSLIRIVLKQVERSLLQVTATDRGTPAVQQWGTVMTHYRDLTVVFVKQTERRVIDGEKVPA